MWKHRQAAYPQCFIGLLVGSVVGMARCGHWMDVCCVCICVYVCVCVFVFVFVCVCMCVCVILHIESVRVVRVGPATS